MNVITTNAKVTFEHRVDTAPETTDVDVTPAPRVVEGDEFGRASVPALFGRCLLRNPKGDR